jgi:membrane protein
MHVPDALPRNFRELASFLRAAWERFEEDRCLQVAGSLAYTTLLALVPLITVALAAATAFPVFGEWTAHLDAWLSENVLPGPIAQSVSSTMSQFAAAAARLTALGLVLVAVTAVMLMLTIDTALNRIFRVSRARPMAQKLLMYWAVLTLGPALMGASISMTSYVVSASLGLARGLPLVGELVLRVAPVLLTGTAITLVFLIVPYRRVRLRHALIGGFLAGVGFELMQRAFALYIAHFPTYRLVYGAFAAIPIFLVWLYLSWVVVLFGATLTAMIPGYQRAERRGRPAGRQFQEALDILARLAEAQRAGRVLAVAHVVQELRMPPDQCERLLERMERRGWVARAAGEGWLLARDAHELRLEEVFRAFVIESMPPEGRLRMTLAEAAAR